MSNPYLEYVVNTTNPNPVPAAEAAPDDLAFTPVHTFTFGPLSIDCDLDPSDGVMGASASFFGFKFFKQKFTVQSGTVAADCTRGPMNVHLQLTPNFANHSIAYQIRLCMLTACKNLAGTMGGFTMLK